MNLSVFSLCVFATIVVGSITTNAQSVCCGKLEQHMLTSRYVSARNVAVWLPDNYSPQKKYPVLYMHDGQMLFDSLTTWNKQEWKVDEVVARLIQKKMIRPMIVVAVWNTTKRYLEYFPQKTAHYLPPVKVDTLLKSARKGATRDSLVADSYLKFLTEEVKPFIDKTYSTLPTRENTFIAGSSMGGLISWYAMCEYPNVFGGAACLSTHWPGTLPVEGKENFFPAFYAYLEKNIPSAKNHSFYFVCGDVGLDAHYPTLQKKAEDLFRKRGYTDKNFRCFVEKGGEHNERTWAKQIDKAFLFLMKK